MGRILGRGIGYIAQIILARLLAPEGFGLFAIGWTILRLFSIAGHLGLDYGVISFGSRHWQKDQSKLRSIIILSCAGAFLSGVLFGTLLYLAAPWVAACLFRKVELVTILRGFAFTFPFATTLRVMAAASSISGRMTCGALAEDISQSVIQMLLFLWFFYAGLGLNAAVFSTTLSYALSVVIAIGCLARNIPGFISIERITTEDGLRILRYSLPAITGVTLGAFNLWGDRLLMGLLGTTEQTGMYQSISMLTMLTTTLLSGLKITIAPRVSQMFHNSDLAGLKLLAKSGTRWALYISMPLLLVIFIAPKEILVTIFGKGYVNGTVPMVILAIGQIFYVAFGLTDQFFLMTRRQSLWFRISSLVFMLTIILDIISIPKQGLIGAAVVSSLMLFTLGAISIITFRILFDGWPVDIYHFKVLLSGLISTTGTLVVVNQLHLDPVPKIIFSFFLSIIIFLFSVAVTGLESNDKLLIYQSAKRLFRTGRQKPS